MNGKQVQNWIWNSRSRNWAQFCIWVLLFLINTGENKVLVLKLPCCHVLLLTFSWRSMKYFLNSIWKNTTIEWVFCLGLNLPLGVNSNRAFLAKAYLLQCHPTAKSCSPCTEVSILARAPASGTVAENDGTDTEVADRLTMNINLWTHGSWSDHCVHHLSCVLSFCSLCNLIRGKDYFIKFYLPTNSFCTVV